MKTGTTVLMGVLLGASCLTLAHYVCGIIGECWRQWRRTCYSRSRLVAAARAENIDMVREMIARSVKPRNSDIAAAITKTCNMAMLDCWWHARTWSATAGRVALCEALDKGRMDIAVWLVKHGADPIGWPPDSERCYPAVQNVRTKEDANLLLNALRERGDIEVLYKRTWRTQLWVTVALLICGLGGAVSQYHWGLVEHIGEAICRGLRYIAGTMG